MNNNLILPCPEIENSRRTPANSLTFAWSKPARFNQETGNTARV
jgi:hypothetical protein